jgi:hypothetical protein
MIVEVRSVSAIRTRGYLTSVPMDEPLIVTRGIGGVRRGQQKNVQFQNGEQGHYLSVVLESIQADLVLTRWFNHQ